VIVPALDGYLHAELAIYHSEEWMKHVDEFITRSN